jgi:DNA-binding transcriptional MerR regulator
MSLENAKVSKIRKKSSEAFRTIREVAEEIGVEQHVLRFWETKFNQIEPMRRGGGRRYYRPEDVSLIKAIKNLLHNQRYTIEGVQNLLKTRGEENVIKIASGELIINKDSTNHQTSEKITNVIKETISDLTNLKDLLKTAIN